MQINRIRLTALVVATLLGMLGTNAKASPPITGQSPLTWLRVSAPSDPQFGSLVKQAIGEEATAALADVLPYSVVVTNNGSSPLVGVAVTFPLEDG